MTFSLSAPEWSEAQSLHASRQLSWIRRSPLLSWAGVLVCLALWVLRPSWFGFGCLFVTLAASLDLQFWMPARIKKRLNQKFQRLHDAGRTPPIQIKMSEQGITFGTVEGTRMLPWNEISELVEGELVWLFRPREKQKALLAIPKSALQNEDAKREWTFALQHFFPVSTVEHPPLASP